MADFKEEITNKTGYLDYNATTPLAPSVLEIINETLRDAWGNPSSSHIAGKKAKEVISLARSRVAKMIGAREDDIIFTSGGTEANNAVFWSVVKHFNANYNGSRELPHIITSNIEHDSVSLAIENLVKEGYCEKSVVGISPTSGMVDVDKIIEGIKPNTCLVSIMMGNNESGVIQVHYNFSLCDFAKDFSILASLLFSSPTVTHAFLSLNFSNKPLFKENFTNIWPSFIRDFL